MSGARVLLVALLAALASAAVRAQQPAADTRRVGTIDLFGYSGWDRDDPHTQALRDKLAARVGSDVQMAAKASFRRKVQGDTVAITGNPATDVAVICCNQKGALSVFVGMQGESAVPTPQRATPVGTDTLPPEAVTLYENDLKALAAAEARGDAVEDGSQAYAPAHDPATRAAEEQMRTFAAARADVVLRVLRHSSNVQQRRAAALLLGYAERSQAQVRALEDAINDDDDEVRNNAAGALAVLAAAGPLPGLNPEQVLGLLYSGVWTDRSKASALLFNLTAKHDAKLLKILAQQALPPLIEGAQWQSKPHAFAFAMVLGRVLGMPDDRSSTLFNGGQVNEIVQQAQALERRGAKR